MTGCEGARNAPTHACPGGCGAQVRPSWYACRPCWFRIPKTLREAVWAGWRAQPHGPMHRAAMLAAGQWLAANPRTPAPSE